MNLREFIDRVYAGNRELPVFVLLHSTKLSPRERDQNLANDFNEQWTLMEVRKVNVESSKVVIYIDSISV